MPRMTRAGAAAMLMALVLGTALWPVDALPRPQFVQDAPVPLIEAASGPIGEPTMRLIGRNAYGGDTIALYGYLPAVVGLVPGELFTGSTRSVETARYTYAGELTIVSAEDRADVTETRGEGILRVYRDDDAGATWGDPASFADGELVAEYALDVWETVQRQAPEVGVAVGEGQMEQTLAGEFALGDVQIRFGHEGLGQRLRYVGAQIPPAEAGVQQAVSLTGSVTVTRRESQFVPLGSPGAIATPAAVNDACRALETWLSGTQAGLAQVSVLGADIGPDVNLTALDAAELDAAADAAAALVAAQRERDVPEGAAGAHRLAVTAMSTTARALQVLAEAADQQDAQLLEQGRAILTDGASLIARADEAANAVAAACASAANPSS